MGGGWMEELCVGGLLRWWLQKLKGVYSESGGVQISGTSVGVGVGGA